RVVSTAQGRFVVFCGWSMGRGGAKRGDDTLPNQDEGGVSSEIERGISRSAKGRVAGSAPRPFACSLASERPKPLRRTVMKLHREALAETVDPETAIQRAKCS